MSQINQPPASSPERNAGDLALRLPPVRWLVTILAYIACIALFATMVLTFVDVLGRYVFNAPVQGGYQMIRGLMAILFFSGLPLVTFSERHLTVGLFDEAFRGIARKIRAIVVTALSLGAMSVLAWQLVRAAQMFQRNREILDTINLPIFPFAYFMSLMAALSALIMAMLLIIHILKPADGA